jgi:hypothetical protein
MEAYFTIFNQKADEFFKDLIDGFPKTPEYNVLKNMDNKQPQRIFRDYIIETYRDKIANEDESFFLSKNDFEITSRRKEYWMDFIDKIKMAWAKMDDENKKIIWKYFRLLVALSDKCEEK